MKVCGVELSSKNASLVVLEGDFDDFNVINSSQPKLSIANDESDEDVKHFMAELKAFHEQHSIQAYVIRARKKTGRFAGGAVSFKLEGLFQLLDCPSQLLSAKDFNAIAKRHGNLLDPSLKKYQENAFYSALAYLKNNQGT